MRTLAVVSLPFALGACTESGSVLGPGREPPPASAASSVGAGMTHACAIVAGAGHCWGANADGQLGTGDTDARNSPSPVQGAAALASVCAGDSHSCAIDTTGGVWCWGGNSRGQLGTGTRAAAPLPEAVSLPGPARSVSCSFNHTCAVLNDDRLYCWGQNGEGELGQDDGFPGEGSLESDGLSPLLVAGTYRVADAGQGHTCAISVAGELFCWGRNSFYELGAEPQGQVRRPLRVGGGSDWEGVDAGQNHSCGLRRDGTLWCWGRNTASEEDEGFPLGIEGSTVVATPTRVGTGASWAALSTHVFHTCAVDRSNALACWGRNIEGQLGLGEAPLIRTPTPVPGAVAAVATGGFFSCAIQLGGALVCAGENRDGQLGTADNDRRNAFGPATLP